MPRVAILFDNFGPYHLSRLRAASAVCEVLAVEFGSASAEYDWKASEAEGLKRVALNERGSSHELSSGEFRKRLARVLEGFRPEALLVPGWGYSGALMALEWGIAHQVPVICMSESTQWDEVRNPKKEWIKRRIIGLFSSALVGGTPHRAYMEELGMPGDRIFLGYDAVDNGFFGTKSQEIQNSGLKLAGPAVASHTLRQVSGFAPSGPYFLASARFIEKKNLPQLIRAYAEYRQNVENQAPRNGCGRLPTVAPWGRHCSSAAGAVNRGSRVDGINSGFTSADALASSLQPSAFDLVLLGDGELRNQLEKLRSEFGLEGSIQMPGFKQYEELPAYYAHAGAFIHASTTEQWGLVVNEAMASGLPVLVSNRCGCAADLVRNGENGWTFDPTNEGQLAGLMLKISSDEERRKAMGAKSREIIAEWGPERFASGVKSAVDAALAAPKKKAGLLDRLILSFLTRR